MEGLNPQPRKTGVERMPPPQTVDETIDKVIDEKASRLSVEIGDEAFLVFKKDIPLYEKTESLEKFAEQKIKGATSDNMWNPTNLRRLLNKIMDSVVTNWNGSSIKSMIFKIGKKIIKEREEDFIEHGI